MSATSEIAQIQNLFKAGLLEEAERALRALNDRAPLAISEQILFGATLCRLGRLDEAIRELRGALDRDPNSAAAWNWIAQGYRRSGQIKQSEGASAQVLRLKPGDPVAPYNLGLCKLESGDSVGAKKFLVKAAEMMPRNLEVKEALATVHLSLGEFEEAEIQMREIIAINPQSESWLSQLASLLINRLDYEGALEIAETMLLLNPESSVGESLAVRAETLMGNVQGARVRLTRFLDRVPASPAICNSLGIGFQIEGDFQKAREFFEISLLADPKQGSPYWGLLQGNGNSEESTAWLPNVIQIGDDPSVSPQERAYAYFSAGKINDQQGNYLEAARSYDRANELAKSSFPHVQRFNPDAYGKAFNRIKAQFSAEFMARNRSVGSPEFRPIFVVGMIRSGTTLLEQMIGRHPSIQTGGEGRFWLQLSQTEKVLFKNGGIDPAAARRLSDQYSAHLKSIASEGSRVTEKLPQNIQILGLIASLFPNAKFLNLTRSRFENCLSIYFTPFAIPPDYAHDRSHIRLAYDLNRNLADYWQTVTPTRTIIDVSYERLVAEPETTIREVLAFLDLEWDERCIRPEENRRNVSTPSLWQVRQPIYRDSVDRIQHYGDLFPEFI